MQCAIAFMTRMSDRIPCPQAQQAAAASQRLANGEPGADEDSSSDEEGSEDEDGDAMDAEVRWDSAQARSCVQPSRARCTRNG